MTLTVEEANLMDQTLTILAHHVAGLSNVAEPIDGEIKHHGTVFAVATERYDEVYGRTMKQRSLRHLDGRELREAKRDIQIALASIKDERSDVADVICELLSDVTMCSARLLRSDVDNALATTYEVATWAETQNAVDYTNWTPPDSIRRISLGRDTFKEISTLLLALGEKRAEADALLQVLADEERVDNPECQLQANPVTIDNLIPKVLEYLQENPDKAIGDAVCHVRDQHPHINPMHYRYDKKAYYDNLRKRSENALKKQR